MKESKEQTKDLIKRLQEEKDLKFKGGIYHRIQIDLAIIQIILKAAN